MWGRKRHLKPSSNKIKEESIEITKTILLKVIIFRHKDGIIRGTETYSTSESVNLIVSIHPFFILCSLNPDSTVPNLHISLSLSPSLSCFLLLEALMAALLLKVKMFVGNVGNVFL